MRFTGFVIGSYLCEDHAWPEPPTSEFEDGEGPHWMVTDDWIGCFIAVDSPEAADALCCDVIDEQAAVHADGDSIREYFDVAADVAQEEWNIYREMCADAGLHPGVGHVLFVMGTVDVGEQQGAQVAEA